VDLPRIYRPDDPRSTKLGNKTTGTNLFLPPTVPPKWSLQTPKNNRNIHRVLHFQAWYRNNWKNLISNKTDALRVAIRHAGGLAVGPSPPGMPRRSAKAASGCHRSFFAVIKTLPNNRFAVVVRKWPVFNRWRPCNELQFAQRYRGPHVSCDKGRAHGSSYRCASESGKTASMTTFETTDFDPGAPGESVIRATECKKKNRSLREVVERSSVWAEKVESWGADGSKFESYCPWHSSVYLHRKKKSIWSNEMVWNTLEHYGVVGPN
jgi:hypothetical protein